MVFDVPAKNFAHADVDEIEIFFEQPCLRTLPAALNAHDNVFVHADASLKNLWK